ncbi:MAG: ribonuclease [Curvibacter sp.]|nr:ribonuclease [Curvibacter sp.]
MLQNVAARTSRALLTCLWLAAALAGTSLVHARETPATDGLTTVALPELPAQGRETYQLILQGGPFRHAKDGVVFGNREHILPAHKRGFYREYTVRTPGERDRGARRIVCGGLQPTAPDACYYSDDHYASFRRIVE